MLKGQAKKDFVEWYNNHIKTYEDTLISGTDIHYFNLLTPSMQYGVLVDWFDSVGIDVDSILQIIFALMDKPRDKPQARQKAIEQANEIYNDRK